jgi:hypothetical protein
VFYNIETKKNILSVHCNNKNFLSVLLYVLSVVASYRDRLLSVNMYIHCVTLI